MKPILSKKNYQLVKKNTGSNILNNMLIAGEFILYANSTSEES